MESTNSIRERIKAVIIESWDLELPAGVIREVPNKLLERTRLLTVVGPRRAGKTYLCHQFARELLSKNVPKRSIVSINWEDERLTPLTGRELTELLPAYQEIVPWDIKAPLYLFLDEIQNVPNWSKWTRRIFEQYPSIHMVLTGSSSKLLSTELATELRGRGLSIQLFPYSFREWLSAEAPVPAITASERHAKNALHWVREFDRYLSSGGFPAVRHNPQPRETLQEYYRVMFLRDLVERYKIRHVALLEDFLKIQLSRFSSLSSISNIHRELLPVHGNVSKNTLARYARAAKDIRLLFDAERYSHKVRQHLLFPKKVYGVDHGLLSAIRFSATEDRGRFLENMVYIELKRRGHEPFYFKDRKECDFVIQNGPRNFIAIQSCWSLSEAKTRTREIEGLIEALNSLRAKDGWIITRNDFDDMKQGSKRIHIRPFWYFAIDKREIPLSSGKIV